MIKMRCGVAGDKFSISSGATTDRFTKEEEDRYIKAGLAYRVKNSKKKTTKKAK